MLDFKNRTAIVTGAGQGIGRAHAMALSARGARVVVNDVVAARAQAVVEEIGAAGGTAVGDTHHVVTAADRIVGAAVDAFGGLDIVVANAGIARLASFSEQPVEEFWSVFDVSFKGTVELARAAWPHLVESGTGRLIMVSSGGVLASPGRSAYGAAKGAVWALGNTLAAEGDEVGIQVTTIMPTAWTPMTQEGHSDPVVATTLKDSMTAEHVAAFVAYLAHQDTAVHGDFFQVAGNHAGRLVLCGLPRIFVSSGTAEEWAAKSDQLRVESDDLEQYRLTSERFAAEVIASNPALRDVFLRLVDEEDAAQ